MTSKAKHMKRSRRSYKDIAFQSSFKRLAWVREYDTAVKNGIGERIRNYLQAASKNRRGENEKAEEEKQ